MKTQHPSANDRHTTLLSGEAFLVFCIIQFVGIMGMLSASLLIVYAALLGGYFLVLMHDRRSLPRAADFSVVVEMPHSPMLGSEVPLSARVSGYRLDRLRGKMFIVAPPVRLIQFAARPSELLPIVDAEGQVIRGERGGKLVGSAHRLGYEAFEHIGVLAKSASQLWYREFRAPCARVSYRVQPPLAAIPPQRFSELVMSQRILTQGSRQLMRERSADQFHSMRDYQYPDPLRHVDQRKSARYGRLMTRVYETFRQHHLVIVLDVGRALCGSIRGSSKHNYYLSVALALARHGVHSGDRVSFISFARQSLLVIREARRLDQFDPVFRGDLTTQPREEGSAFEHLPSFVARVTGQRSIVVLLTDIAKPSVQSSLLRVVPPLSQKHLFLAAGMIDRQFDITRRVESLEATSFSPEQWSDLLYAYWVDDETRTFARHMNHHGAAAVAVSEEYWMSAVPKIYERLRSSLAM